MNCIKCNKSCLDSELENGICYDCRNGISPEKTNYNIASNSKQGLYSIIGTILAIICIPFILFNILNNSDNNTNTVTSSQTSTVLNTQGSIGSFYFKIGDGKIVEDGYGNYIFLVSITFKNNASIAYSFYQCVDCVAYQNNVEITTPTFSYGIDNYNWEDKTREVKPGNSYTFNLAFQLSNLSSDVEIDIHTNLFETKYSTRITKTFKLK